MILRHPNGRGELRDDAEANLSTYISKDSYASGSAKLRDCELKDGSRAIGRCQIYGGEFTRTIIAGDTIVAGHPSVVDSHLNCSEVSGRPRIVMVGAIGTTEISDTPHLIGEESSGIVVPLFLRDAVIYGSPIIAGSFEVTGRVHEGSWTRPPKHIKLPWCDLSECVDGKVLLDCWCKPASWWLRFGRRIAAKWDWSEDQVSVTLATIEREFLYPWPPPLLEEAIRLACEELGG